MEEMISTLMDSKLEKLTDEVQLKFDDMSCKFEDLQEKCQVEFKKKEVLRLYRYPYDMIHVCHIGSVSEWLLLS